MTYLIIINIIISVILLFKNIKSSKPKLMVCMLVALNFCILAVILSVSKHISYPGLRNSIFQLDYELYQFISTIKIPYNYIQFFLHFGILMYVVSNYFFPYLMISDLKKTWYKYGIFPLFFVLAAFVMSTPHIRLQIYYFFHTLTGVQFDTLNALLITSHILYLSSVFLLSLMQILIYLSHYLKAKMEFLRRQYITLMVCTILTQGLFLIFFFRFSLPIYESFLLLNYNNVSEFFFIVLPLLLILATNIQTVLIFRNNIIEPLSYIQNVRVNYYIKRVSKTFKGNFHTYKNNFFILKILSEELRNTDNFNEAQNLKLNNMISICDASLKEMEETLHYLKVIVPVRQYCKISDIVAMLKSYFTEYNCDNSWLNFHCTSSATIHVDKNFIVNCLVNFTQNAIDACKEKQYKKVDITILHENHYVFINIKDNGDGIPREKIKNVLKPRYHSDGNSTNWGIGLNYNYRVIKANGGYIFCNSKANEFTEFQIIFPTVNKKEKGIIKK